MGIYLATCRPIVWVGGYIPRPIVWVGIYLATCRPIVWVGIYLATCRPIVWVGGYIPRPIVWVGIYLATCRPIVWVGIYLASYESCNLVYWKRRGNSYDEHGLIPRKITTRPISIVVWVGIYP